MNDSPSCSEENFSWAPPGIFPYQCSYDSLVFLSAYLYLASSIEQQISGVRGEYIKKISYILKEFS